MVLFGAGIGLSLLTNCCSAHESDPSETLNIHRLAHTSALNAECLRRTTAGSSNPSREPIRIRIA